jgi:hypothetical protein
VSRKGRGAAVATVAAKAGRRVASQSRPGADRRVATRSEPGRDSDDDYHHNCAAAGGYLDGPTPSVLAEVVVLDKGLVIDL